MEITIKGNTEEIADLITQAQGQQQNLTNDRWPPMNIREGNNSFWSYCGGGQPTGYGGNGINYNGIASGALVDINRTLATMCSLIKDFRIPLDVKSE